MDDFNFELFFGGLIVGYIVGQLLLVFFEREIFRGIDRAVDSVRKFLRLD